jgi:carbamoyltransferase
MSTSTYILGISAFYHDSAACLLRDGEIVAAAQEERFTRTKGDASFPQHAVEYCLRSEGITQAELAFVGFYDKPLLKFERILETYLGWRPVACGPSSWPAPCGSRTSSTWTGSSGRS